MNDQVKKKVNKKMRKLLMIGGVLAVLGVAGVFFYMHFLSPDAWMCGAKSAGRGVDEDGNPWLGAGEPELVIHEVLDFECPHCPTAHQVLRYALRSDLDRIRLVRHDYARMECVPNDAKIRRSSCLMARAAHCAGVLGDYWQWNDAVIESPRPYTGPERKTYLDGMVKRFGFDPAKFDQCLYDPQTVEAVQKDYKYAKSLKIMDTPTYILNGKKHTLQELLDTLD